MEDLSGKHFGQYQIVAEIGQGGMASVYKAYQPSVERYAAVKVLPRHLAGDPLFIKRFRQEALLLAKLQHPHILPVFEYGEAEGYTYLVMPYIDSGTLKDVLRGKPLPLRQIRSIISQIGDALDYAHSRGLVHRDVKPSNVLVDERGNCLLTDFGIAKIIEGSSKLTGSGGVIGTPAYMAPEQGRGDPVDARADIYALGIMLFEMATGRVPFEADTPVAVIFKHIQDDLPAPRSLNPALPETVEQVIQKALSKNPADRFSTAGEMVAALQAALPAETGSTSPPLSPTWRTVAQARPVSQPKPRSACLWVIAGAAALLVLSLLGGGIAGADALVKYFNNMDTRFAATQTALGYASQPTRTRRPSQTPALDESSNPTAEISKATEMVVVITRGATTSPEAPLPPTATAAQPVEPTPPTLAATLTRQPTGAPQTTPTPPSATSVIAGDWQPLLGLPRSINALTVDPNDPLTLYAATGSQNSGAGVYKSTDGGLTWQSASDGLPYNDVRALAISLGDAPTLYAVAALGQVYTSADGAVSWRQLAETGLYGGFSTRLVADPTGQVLFAIIIPGGLARSTDGGQSWQKLNQGLPADDQGAAYVRTLALGANPDEVYAGTGGFIGQGHGVFKSIDGGDTWTAANQGMVDYVIAALAVSPHDAQTVYAAGETGEFFVSVDAAQSWEDLSAGLSTSTSYNVKILDIFVDPVTPGNLALLLESDGILLSSDGGRSWSKPLKPASEAYFTSTAASVIFNPGAPGVVDATILIAQREAGGYRYAQGQPALLLTPTPSIFPDEVAEAPLPQGSWQPLADLPRQINAFAFNPADPQTVYAATGDNGSGSGVYTSLDGGLTWQLTANGLPSQDVLALAVAPDNPLNLYAGLSGNDDFYISADGAQTWNISGSSGTYGSFGRDLFIHPLDSQLIFSLSSPNKMTRSADGGATWQMVKGGVPADEYNTYVLSLAFDPLDPHTLYAGSGGFGNSYGYGVYKSTDGGLTWQPANTGMFDRLITALAVDPANPQTVFAGTSQGELFISIDGALSWIDLTSRLPWGEPTYNAIQALFIDPNQPDVMVMLVDQVGVVISSSGGAGWQTLGLPPGQDGGWGNLSVIFASAAQSAHPLTLFLSIDGVGGWRYAP